MNLEEIKTLEKQYVMQTYARNDLFLVNGQGCMLYDDKGNSYIDMTSGIGVNCLGHNHPALVEALHDQSQKLMHTSNLYYTEPMVQVAKELVESTGMSKVFFANSGAEANEGVIKLARKYSSDRYGQHRYKVLSLVQSFHGRTMMTLTATGQDKFHQYFYPFPDGFEYVIANDIEDFKQKLDDSVCLVLMEMIQGEGGVLPLDKTFVQEVTKLCHQKDVLVAVDEVQTGIGRTGSLFCYQQYEIQPDIVSMAKGLGGGLPIGGIMTNEKCSTVLQAGMHGSTFGGNLMSTRAAMTVLSIINQKEFLESVKEKGKYFMDALQNIQSQDILEVRGMGLMIGVVVDEKKRAGFVKKLQEKGVLVLTAGSQAIRLLPPLIISKEEPDQVIQAFQEVFS